MVFSTSLALLVLTAAHGDDAPAKADSPMVKMLRSGKVPEARQGTIIEMIGKRGSAADLTYLLDRVLDPAGIAPATRSKAVQALTEAALTREVRPEGDLERLAPLISPPGGKKVDGAMRLAAVKLAGLWKVAGLSGALRSVAETKETSGPLRAAALESLGALGGADARATISALTKPDRPANVRALAVAALAKLDVKAAAHQAAALLREGAKDVDLGPLLSAFLNLKGGTDVLAAAISGASVPADPAKLALRSVYVLGHSDPALVASLTKAAGLDAEVKPLDKAAMDQVLADVARLGDAERGERIFRRNDVNCTKCHAVSGAGGGVGPDLSPIGASSPVDYLVNSIMLPDQAIKEEFQTQVILTNDGQVFQGIVADKDDKRLILKEATGDLRTIPTSEIEETKEGGSLMPKGLVNFMTRAEFLDLVRFLSELGKPGPYAIRSTQTIQRWEFLKPVDDELAKQVPSVDSFRTFAFEADESHWLPAYARTGGALPLDEVVAGCGSTVVYLQGEVEVSEGGPVRVHLDATEGVAAWVDDQPAPAFADRAFEAELAPGRRKLTFRVDTAARKTPTLRAEVLKPEGSAVEYAVVGGR